MHVTKAAKNHKVHNVVLRDRCANLVAIVTLHFLFRGLTPKMQVAKFRCLK
jgi:hypothetical protein